jgi:putative nucleotidyltransferase with HDIG domain
MSETLKILILEDNPADAELIMREIGSAGLQVEWHRAATQEDYLAHLGQPLDLVLADYTLPSFDALQALRILHERELDLPLIVVTGSVSEEAAVECMRMGAADYLLKDRLARLGDSVRQAVEKKRLREEQRRDHAALLQSIDRLSTLRAIDMTITASLDPRVTFEVILDRVTIALGADAADILLYDKHTRVLKHVASRGIRGSNLSHAVVPLGDGLAGQVARDRHSVGIVNLAENPGALQRPELKAEGFISYFASPLLARGTVNGVLEVFHRSQLEPDREWVQFLEALAAQAAIAIDNATLFEELHRANLDLIESYDTTLEGWVKALDLRDNETEGHTQRVTQMTVTLARRMGVREADLEHLRRGALLHDIGKMAISDAVLRKPGPLTAEEWTVMRRHPVHAMEWLSPIPFLRLALEIPYCHHEQWDGNGYPRGLKGEQIPRSARIFAAVDVWDALTSNRPYRPAWPAAKAVAYIQEERGRHFDPEVVDAFLEMRDLWMQASEPALTSAGARQAVWGA